MSSILKFIIMLMCLRPIFEYIFTKLVYSKCFSLLWYAFGLYTWPKIMFLHRAVLNYFRLYSPYISILFHFFIQFFEKNQVTYFVSSSCFFWKLFRMNYFMTILVFPKLFVFALFLYVIRFRFSTWLPTILVALPLPYSSSKGDRLIRDTRLFGYVAFNERCEALWSFTRFQALWQFSLVDPKCLWHRMTWKTVFVHHIQVKNEISSSFTTFNYGSTSDRFTLYI